MTPTVAESTTMDQPTYCEQVAEAIRGAANVSREAHALKTRAVDAIDDGLHTARRTVKQARQRALDVRDDLTYRIKRQPLKAVAIAFGAGTLAGLLFGWARQCPRTEKPHSGGL